MRMHTEMDDILVAQVDELADARGRSAFVRRAIEQAVQLEQRWNALRSSAGAVAGEGHDWDVDPAAWVRDRRRADRRRAGLLVLHILDSTVLIDYLRGRPVVRRVEALHARGDVAATTAINVEEIVRGLRRSEDQAARRLFSGLEVLDVDSGAALQAGEWRREYAALGVTLWRSDCLIAAVALQAGGLLATGNSKDFPMVEVVHWPGGE